jgi:hypothetical protein
MHFSPVYEMESLQDMKSSFGCLGQSISCLLGSGLRAEGVELNPSRMSLERLLDC